MQGVQKQEDCDKEEKKITPSKCRVPGCIQCGNDNTVDPQSRYSKYGKLGSNN